MSRSAILTGLPGLALLLQLAAFGGGGGPPSSDSTAIRTLAYVVTDNHGDATGTSWTQRLEILRGDHAAVTVAEIPTCHLPPLDLPLCELFGQYRVTSTLGVRTAAGGSVDVQLPGPQAYSARSGANF